MKGTSDSNLSKNIYNPNYVGGENLEEDKVYNQYLAYNPSRIQAIKHVATNFKPEYLSLEEIQKQREEHMKVLLKTENEFYEKKKKGEQLINIYGSEKLAKDKNVDLNDINEPFDIKEIEEALRKEEQEFKNKKIKKLKNGFMKPRARSVQKLRKYNDVEDKPLNREESKYVKKYMNYLLKKKYKGVNDEEFKDQEDWNKTKVRSMNSKVLNRGKNDIPGKMDVGHVDKKDYSMYYMSINSDSPRSLSIEDGRRSKGRKNRAKSSKMSHHQGGPGNGGKKAKNLFSGNNSFSPDNRNNNNFSPDDMNFKSSIENLIQYNNMDGGEIDYNKLNNFLSSNSDMKDFMKSSATNLNENLQTNPNTLNTATQWNKTMKNYNVSKSSQYMMNLKRNITNEKLDTNYSDMKDFARGLKPRNDLFVTIPKPPSFYDAKGKKEKKINEILNERIQKEDEILSKKFKANELKREIFISEFENVIVAEKALRMQRCEKLKEKIVQDMKPFSFYDVDEKKYKEKLVKECMPPEFLPFKANPITWTSQINLYEDILTKQAVERNQRIEERARQNLLSAKLPPRMEMHEKKKKLQEEEIKSMEKTVKSSNNSKKKSFAKKTETKPFTFHDPKVNKYFY